MCELEKRLNEEIKGAELEAVTKQIFGFDLKTELNLRGNHFPAKVYGILKSVPKLDSLVFNLYIHHEEAYFDEVTLNEVQTPKMKPCKAFEKSIEVPYNKLGEIKQ